MPLLLFKLRWSIKQFYLIFLLLPLYLSSQVDLEPDKYVFGNVKAGTDGGRIASNARSTFRMSGSPRSISMVRRVGGVSFDQVAQPREGLAIDSIYLEYDSLATDGNRLKVSFFSDDTKTITAKIPDWQLIPISNYANSEFTALVSLYGENISLDKSQIVYHESVLNSLLGLRLFHADLLLTDESGSLWELPRRSSVNLNAPAKFPTIIGAGEEKFLPDSANLSKYRYAFNRIKSIQSMSHSESYILTDYETEVKFDITDSLLLISGEPYYLFNSTKIDPQTYLEYIYNYVQELRQVDTSSIARNKKLDRIEEIYLDERFSWSKREVEKIVNNLFFYYVEANYLEELDDELNRIPIPKSKRKKYPYKEIKFLKDVMQSDTTMYIKYAIDSIFSIERDRAYHEAVKAYYENWKKEQKSKKKYQPKSKPIIEMQIDSSMIAAHFNKDLKRLYDLYDNSTTRLGPAKDILRNMKYVDLALFFSQQEEVYIHGCLIEGMKANNQHIYNYNPAVMNATVQTMRYAAFFRYVKEHFPVQWEQFLSQIETVEDRIYKDIKTPTSYNIKR